MNLLRERLKEASPELYRSLENSWQVAYENWLPALASKSDSYNSYPHLRNLESYLQQIMQELEKHSRSVKVIFSPLEWYVLLASILFHDIGMISAEKKSDHAKKSAEIVEGHPEALGIPSREIATVISNICKSHGLKPDEFKKEGSDLTTLNIHPHGKVRQLEMASMLYLIDHMDGAFTRVVPNFIKETATLEPVGAFRNEVKGVFFDYHAQMICTELGAFVKARNSNMNEHKKRILNIDLCADCDKIDKIKNECNLEEKDFDPRSGDEMILKREKFEERYLRQEKDKDLIILKSQAEIIKYIKIKWFKFSQIDDDLMKAPFKVKKKDKHMKWPETILLAMILNDYTANRKALNVVKDNLARLGLFIKNWLLSYEEHLFQDEGKKTFEPVLHKAYLKYTAKKMWELTTQVFGSSYFTFENLAAEIREPDIEKVKMAVRRLAILSKSKNTSSQQTSGIWAGNKHWKWLSERGANDCCKGMSLYDLQRKIPKDIP